MEKYEDYLEHMRKRGCAEKTIKEHRRFLFGALSHSVQDTELGHLTLIDVAKILEAGRNHGEYGPQRAVCVFRRYLQFLQQSGIKFHFDWRDITLPKVPQKQQVYYTKEELEQILEAVMTKTSANHICRLRMRALLEVLFGTGMRISEALQLRRAQFGQIKTNHECLIRNAKTKDEEIVIFNDRAVEWLDRYLDARKDNSEAMFVNNFGRPLLMVTAKSNLLRHRNEWGVEKVVKFHGMRRSFTNYLIDRGADIKTVQTLVRHKSERTTLRYYIAINMKKAKAIHQQLMCA